MAAEFQGAVRREFGGHDIAWVVVRAEQGLVKGGGLWCLMRLAHGNDLQGNVLLGQKKRSHYFSQKIQKICGPAAGGKYSNFVLLFHTVISTMRDEDA